MGGFLLRNAKLLLLTGLIVLALAVFLMLGPPQLLARSEKPDFCAACHVMESEYEAWFHEGAHRRINCVDCHLPYTNVAAHYIWKSIDGMKDVVVFYSGKVPENITASEHAQKTVQQNCIRCHETAVEMIDNERQCWSCHRRMMHLGSGGIQVR